MKECNHNDLIYQLREYLNDEMPRNMQCDIPGCQYRTKHHRDAHICQYCRENHAENDCTSRRTIHRNVAPQPNMAPQANPAPQPNMAPQAQPVHEPMQIDNSPPTPPITEMHVMCPVCRENNIVKSNQKKVTGVDNVCVVCRDKNSDVFFPKCGHICVCVDCCQLLNQQNQPQSQVDIVLAPDVQPTQQFAETRMGQTPGRIYIIVPAGMGCCWYIRRNDVGQPIETFFMHSDNWGQYGPESSDVPQLQNFIRDYTQLVNT
jgi:hypothetical protein